MKGLLIYFSGTGNSKFIANCIKNEFTQKGHNIILHSIENKIYVDWNSYDFFIFGSPKYYEHTPLFFIDWIRKNVSTLGNKKNCILFCTGTAPVATSFKTLEKILKTKNIVTVTTKTFQMPNNYLFGIFNSTSEQNYDLYCKWSAEKVGLMVQDFLDGIYIIEKINSVIGFICKNASYHFCKTSNSKSKYFSVDSDCTKCKLCIQNCPTNNIEIKDNKINFKNNCILCTRCINFCPQNAILYKNKKPIQYTYNSKYILNNL